MNAAPAHGAYQRHPVPPPGPTGELHGNPAADRPTPSPRQAVHRTTAAPPVPVYAVGEAPPADLFAARLAALDAASRAARWHDRLAVAGLALAFGIALGAAYIAAHATAGPIRPHVTSTEARP